MPVSRKGSEKQVSFFGRFHLNQTNTIQKEGQNAKFSKFAERCFKTIRN